MIRWQLLDINDTIFQLDDGIFLINSDNFKIDIKLEERTFLDGAVFDGLDRMASKELKFKFNKAFTSDSDYCSYFNEIITAFRSAVKIRDIVRGIETAIEFSTLNIKFEDGCFLRASENSVSLYLKDVYWEAINYNTYSVSSSGEQALTSGNIYITNNGWLPANPIITLNANTTAINILFVVIQTNKGIAIKDLSFGAVGLTEYIINCETGFIMLGGIKKNENIQLLSGPFQIPVGNSTLYYEIDGDVSIEVKFREKAYL